MGRRAWWAAVYGDAQSQTQLKQLGMHAFIGEGNGNPLQCSCLENPRDRGAWWAAVYGVAQSQTRLKLLSSSSSIKTRAKLHGADLMKKLKKSGKNSWREGVFGVPEQFRIVVGKKDKKPYTWGALRRPV